MFRRTATTRALFFIMCDAAIVVASFWIAFLLRFEGAIPQQYYYPIWQISLISIACIIPTFHAAGLYRFSWTFVSTQELITLFYALTFSFIIIGLVIFSAGGSFFTGFPRSTILISYVLIFLASGAIRLSKKVYLHAVGRSRMAHNERTLIVGAGEAGEQLARSIIGSTAHSYFLTGFVDDSNIKQGVRIHGLPVLGKIEDIPYAVREHGIRQMIVALPSAGSHVIRRAIELGRQAGLKNIKVMPPLHEIINSTVSFRMLKNVDVEDLLGRAKIDLNKQEIEQFIKGKKVLITGGAGSIGSELARQVAKLAPQNLVLIDQDETGIFHISQELRLVWPDLELKPIVADITDRHKMHHLFAYHKPQIVFHAAAYKHVPLMEDHVDEAVKNNILGTEVIAAASVENGVETFVFISTDKAVNPTSVMGMTKRIGEMICQAYNGRGRTIFISVRFGNVLNSRGSVIPIFREQITKGGPVQVTHPDMRRYFMLISEACLLVMQAGAMGKGGEVFVLDMGKPIKIVDLAKEMIRLSGLEPDKDIAITFIGTRPGEKLFEEILTSGENTFATQNQSIFIAKLSGLGFENLQKIIAMLTKGVAERDHHRLIEALREIIT